MLNISKLIKILNLCTSDADGEALSALRKANSILKDNKMNWNDLLENKSFSNNNSDKIRRQCELRFQDKIDTLTRRYESEIFILEQALRKAKVDSKQGQESNQSYYSDRVFDQMMDNPDFKRKFGILDDTSKTKDWINKMVQFQNGAGFMTPKQWNIFTDNWNKVMKG